MMVDNIPEIYYSIPPSLGRSSILYKIRSKKWRTRMNIRIVRNTSRVMVAVMLYVATPFIPVSRAAIVTTDQIALQPANQAARERIRAFLDREDTRAQLEAKGVSAAEAQARVNLMTDDEVQVIAGKLDTLPAGGDVLGVALTVFLVLLITDILGLTKVFPFTRPVR
jgi:hypothetical protein